MNESDYKKIELYKTKNLSRDKKIIDSKIEHFEKIMKENNIDYAIEIKAEDVTVSNSNKIRGKLYILNLVVKKEKFDSTIELLNNLGETIIVETEDKMKNTESTKNEIQDNSLQGKIIRAFFIILCLIIIVLELYLLIYSVNEYEYGNAILVTIIIIIELLFMKKIWKKLKNRKGD